MSDSGWFGLSPVAWLGLAGGLGAALSKGIGVIWRTRGEAAAILKAENERLQAALEKVGAEKDQLVQNQLRMAAAVMVQRANPRVPDEFEQDYPSAVRNMADLLDPKAQHKPNRELDSALRSYTDTTPPRK